MSLSSPELGTPHFKKIQTLVTQYSPAKVTQYVSTRSGLSIVVVDRESPIVHGSFALASEILDDSGAPHTLEHLCFMGSKNYPYVGALDKLSTRAYSDTNAYTATSHTEYELDSAGWEGFAEILPVYLEHLIAPTLTDSSCYTEVHHIDGDGNDAGVVYSEMQARENNADMLMYTKSKRLLYPEGIGFRYDTFGMMESLRALTAVRIRKYHQETYQPRNLCLVIVGEVDHENMLIILDKFEDTVLDDIPKPNSHFRRPWVESTPAPPLKASILEVVEFPEEDESTGQITISFSGPRCVDHLLCSAMVVLLSYLAGSSASVLENVLVEKEQVSSAVMFDYEIQPTIAITFTLNGVATNDLERVETRFFELLTETAAKPLELGYIHDCIMREKRQRKFHAENSGEFFTEPIVNDFLFGERDGSTLKVEIETLDDFDILQTWAESKWRHWLTTWFSNAPHVSLLGKPSSRLVIKLSSEEEARIEARKKHLGIEGLENLKRDLVSAKEENDGKVPKEIMKKFKVPSVNSIHFINTTTGRSGTAREMNSLDNPIQNIIDKDTDLSLFIHFEHIESNFARLTVILGTEVVPVNLRPLLAVYMEKFLSSPMLRDGNIIEFEKVLIELEQDTVNYDIGSGSGMGNSETIVIKLDVEADKYETAIRWLRDLMHSSVFDPERIKATTSRLLADIPEDKRDGSSMVNSIELMVGTAPSGFGRARNTLVKAAYLKQVKRILEKEPQVVIDQLKEVNDVLCTVSNFRVLVIANVEKLQHPVSSWKILVPESEKNISLNPLESKLSRLSEHGRNPGDIAYVVPIPPVESSFVLAVGKGPASFDDPTLPALMVANAYLNAVEGPFWKNVRGTGLAYATNLYRHVDSGQISLEIYRSPDPLKALLACREVVQKLATGEEPINDLALEGAISSIVLSFATAEATKASAAEQSFVRQVMRGLPKDWPTLILEKIREVLVDEVRASMRDVVLRLFEANASNLFITCAPIMESKLVRGLEGLGFRPEVRSLASFQDDYGLKEEGGVDEESEDEETEDDDSGESMDDDEDEETRD